ncbi:MAG: flagellar hook-length control protein FliK [Vicinamibacterales bacterium]
MITSIGIGPAAAAPTDDTPPPGAGAAGAAPASGFGDFVQALLAGRSGDGSPRPGTPGRHTGDTPPATDGKGRGRAADDQALPTAAEQVVVWFDWSAQPAAIDRAVPDAGADADGTDADETAAAGPAAGDAEAAPGTADGSATQAWANGFAAGVRAAGAAAEAAAPQAAAAQTAPGRDATPVWADSIAGREFQHRSDDSGVRLAVHVASRAPRAEEVLQSLIERSGAADAADGNGNSGAATPLARRQPGAPQGPLAPPVIAAPGPVTAGTGTPVDAAQATESTTNAEPTPVSASPAPATAPVPSADAVDVLRRLRLVHGSRPAAADKPAPVQADAVPTVPHADQAVAVEAPAQPGAPAGSAEAAAARQALERAAHDPAPLADSRAAAAPEHATVLPFARHAAAAEARAAAALEAAVQAGDETAEPHEPSRLGDLARPAVAHATLAAPTPHLAGAAQAQAAGGPAPGAPPAEVELPDQIVQSLRLQVGRGGGEARVQLKPDYLGELNVRVTVENGVVTARLEAQVPAVREWIERHEASLRQALGDQGLKLETLVVSETADTEDTTPDGRSAPEERDEQQAPSRRRQRPDGSTPCFEIIV